MSNEEIPFTQFLLPNGRPKEVWIKRSPEVMEKAKTILGKGYRFECEMLQDLKTVSLTISKGDQDLACELSENGPSVPLAVDKLVNDFFSTLNPLPSPHRGHG